MIKQLSVLILLLLPLTQALAAKSLELEGKSLLPSMCPVQFESVKTCPEGLKEDAVIGCSFTLKAAPCPKDIVNHCQFKLEEISDTNLEVTISGERGYFSFNLRNKDKLNTSKLIYKETRHNSLWYKEIVTIEIQMDQRTKKPTAIKASEFEVNKLTGKKQISDQVNCQF